MLFTLEGHPVYGAAAASWNREVAAGLAYSTNPANTVASRLVASSAVEVAGASAAADDGYSAPTVDWVEIARGILPEDIATVTRLPDLDHARH